MRQCRHTMTSEPQNTASMPSAPPSPHSPQEVSLEQRLLTLEKGDNRAFRFVQLAMGIFVLFIGFNWWSAKTNYDRDREYFQNRLALAQSEISSANDKQITELRKQTEFSNEKQMNEIRKQADASLISISNNLQNDFVALEHQIDEKRSNAVVAFTNSIMRLATNVQNGMEILITNMNKALDGSIKQNTEILNNTLTNIQGEVNKATAGARGVSLMVQSSSFLNIHGGSKQENLADGADSLLAAAHFLFLAKDEANMRRCVNILCGSCLPQLTQKASKTLLAHLDSTRHLTDKIRALVSDLESADKTGAYSDNISTLKYDSEIIQGKLPTK